MNDQQIKYLSIDIYQKANDDKKKKLQQSINKKQPVKTIYTIHEFNYKDFEIMMGMNVWWKGYVNFCIFSNI